jgi:hypothetical protein
MLWRHILISSVAVKLDTQGSIPAGSTDFSLCHHIQTMSGIHLSLFQIYMNSYFQWVKEPESWPLSLVFCQG